MLEAVGYRQTQCPQLAWFHEDIPEQILRSEVVRIGQVVGRQCRCVVLMGIEDRTAPHRIRRQHNGCDVTGLNFVYPRRAESDAEVFSWRVGAEDTDYYWRLPCDLDRRFNAEYAGIANEASAIRLLRR